MALFCPCRQTRLCIRDKRAEKKENPLVGSHLRAEVDYSAIYHKFTSILTHRFHSEREGLLKLQTILGQWGHVQHNGGVAEKHHMETELLPFRGPRLHPKEWSSEVRADAKGMFFKMSWPAYCPWVFPNKQNCSAREGTPERPSWDNVHSALTSNEGWKHTPSPAWNMLWRFCDVTAEPRADLVWQVQGRHANVGILGTKDSLSNLLNSCWSCAGVDDGPFDLAPKTFELPRDYNKFAQSFANRKANNRPNTWIMKPADGSLGAGIKLLTDVNQALNKDNTIVQHYLDRPLLVQGYKFDMRVYVVVTSFQPLEAFVSKVGLARFTKEKYTPDLSNKYAHLTNTAVQQFCKKPGLLNGASGCEFAKLRELLEAQGVDWNKAWANTKNTILQSLSCSEAEIGHAPNTFQILGCDILLDDELRAWLLEINRRPSLAVKNDLDKIMKPTIVKNITKLLDPLPFDRYALANIVERRLEEVDRPVDPARNRHQLNKDFYEVLGGRMPRQYGDAVSNGEVFDRIAPSDDYFRYRMLLQTCPSQAAH